jgi:structural maintenance of chromosome 3 (chondroitin sulfate proteoglycan 6)
MASTTRCVVLVLPYCTHPHFFLFFFFFCSLSFIRLGTFRQKELEEARAKLEELEAARLSESERAQSSRQETQRFEDVIQDLENRVAELRQRVSTAEREKKSLVEDRAERLKQRTKLELDVADLERSSKDKGVRGTQLKRDLKQLEKKIAARRKELDEEVLPAYEGVRAKEKEAEAKIAEAERVRSELFAKQSRGSRFKSRGERDAFLSKEVASLEKDIKDRKGKMEQGKKELSQAEVRLKTLSEDLAEREEAVAERKQLMEAAVADLQALKGKRDDLTNDRQRLWTQQQELDKRVGEAAQAVAEHDKELMSGTNKSTAEGLESVRRIVQEHSIHGVYGPLMELIQPESMTYDTALDVSAQNMLFAVVTQVRNHSQKVTEERLKRGGK